MYKHHNILDESIHKELKRTRANSPVKRCIRTTTVPLYGCLDSTLVVCYVSLAMR